MTHNILFVDHADGLGGAEHSMLMLMRQLEGTQWRPHLATVSGKLADTAERQGIIVHRIILPRLRRSPTVLFNWITAAREIGRIAKSINALAIHSNTVRASFYAGMAAKLAQIPFIWHMRDFWLSEMRPSSVAVDRRIKQLLCRSARVVLANSGIVKQHLPCSEKVRIVHNGIETAQFQPLDKAMCRAKWGISPDVPVVGMMGRLRPWKGQLAFLEMANKVRQLDQTVHFMIVGGNPFAHEIRDDYAEQVMKQCRQLGLEECVTFTGQLDDVRPALAAMDVFVHPGAPEPFGLVNIEAMAMNLPVIAYAHGALPEIVTHNETGLLVPFTEPDTLAMSVMTLIQCPETAREMGQNGRQRVEEHFDIQYTAQKIKQIYHELV